MKSFEDTFKRRLSLCTALVSAIVGDAALASQQTGTVTLLAVANSDSPDAVVLNGTRTTPPACATDGAWSFKDASVISVILSAKFNNKSITINGTGACAAQHTTREEISYITID